MTDLGTLGGSSSIGAGINAKGDVVGISLVKGSGNYHGFLYRNGQMEDLNPLIDADSSAGGVLLYAYGINDANEITGAGCCKGAQRAFVLKPL